MKGIENQETVLVLNKSWQPINRTRVKDAIVSVCSGSTRALNIEYSINEKGEPDFSKPCKMEPLDWDSWVSLPVYSWQTSLNTVHKKIRCPSVIIAESYNKMPKKKMSLSLANVRELFNWVCAYSGDKLTKSNSSQEHIIPLSRGGKNDWSNVVLARKDLNHKKGNRLNSEIGYKLLVQPKEPTSQPVCAFIKEAKNFEWNFFLMK